MPYVNGCTRRHHRVPAGAHPLVRLYTGPKIAIVILLAIFPVAKNTYAGVVTVGQSCWSPPCPWGHPNCRFPGLSSARRSSLPDGRHPSRNRTRIVGLVVGEFFTAQTGLAGHRAVRQQLPHGRDVRAIIVLWRSAMPYVAVVLLQRRIAPWKETERDPGL